MFGLLMLADIFASSSSSNTICPYSLMYFCFNRKKSSPKGSVCLCLTPSPTPSSLSDMMAQNEAKDIWTELENILIEAAAVLLACFSESPKQQHIKTFVLVL